MIQIMIKYEYVALKLSQGNKLICNICDKSTNAQCNKSLIDGHNRKLSYTQMPIDENTDIIKIIVITMKQNNIIVCHTQLSYSNT